MSREQFEEKLRIVLNKDVKFAGKNFASLSNLSEAQNQNSTNDAFSAKWTSYDKTDAKEKMYASQRRWYLELYGFASEVEFAEFLQGKKFIYDAGCGMGFKAAWFAELAPESVVIGVDFSDAAKIGAVTYEHLPNLFFLQGDIADEIFKKNSIDYVSCDQVIMHTEDPERTFTVLSDMTKADGHFACYFYAKKALPRELIDDYFRTHCTNMSHEDLMEMSKQLTELGKRLSDLKVSFDCPDVPALGIKGGKIDIQRFVYWNFLKCYWNEELGRDTSDYTNFDWYSPSNARRFSKEEVQKILNDNNMDAYSFHEEEACYSGRFMRRQA